MRTKVSYEWTLEEIEDGEIVDCDFAEKLNVSWLGLKGYDLGLVRSEGNEDSGITDSVWAYVKDGKLPEKFCDSTGNTVNINVPKKFHNELKSLLK